MNQFIISLTVPLMDDIVENAIIVAALAPLLKRLRIGLEELDWTEDAAMLSCRYEDGVEPVAKRGRGPNKPKVAAE